MNAPSARFTGQQFGINRNRKKGGASAETLYDLQNAYINADRKFARRAGLRRVAILEPGTKGLAAMKGQLHTFSAVPVPHANPLFLNNPLRHPTGGVAALSKVHFAQPFLARLYVAAEYADAVVQHFWLQNEASWVASKVYTFGRRVRPTVPNGFVYEITNVDATATWAANIERTVGAFVKPTTGGDFKFQASAVTGTPARSGEVEPTWPTTEGATVTEYRSG